MTPDGYYELRQGSIPLRVQRMRGAEAERRNRFRWLLRLPCWHWTGRRSWVKGPKPGRLNLAEWDRSDRYKVKISFRHKKWIKVKKGVGYVPVEHPETDYERDKRELLKL